MKTINRCWKLLPAATLVLFFLGSTSASASPLFGYVGPGAGLSMLGALFAVATVLVLALLGPILYPIRMYLIWRRKRLDIAKPSVLES